MIIATDGYPNGSLGNHFRSVVYDSDSGCLFAAYLSNNGDYRIVREKDGVVEGPYVIDAAGNVQDIHYHVSLTLDDDGYLHVFTDGHNTPGYWRRSSNPLDPTVFLPKQEFHPNTTYYMPYVRDGQLFCIHRTAFAQNLTLSRTTDLVNPQWIRSTLISLANKGPYCQEIDADEGLIVVSRINAPHETAFNRKIACYQTSDGINWTDQHGGQTPVAAWIHPWPFNDITCPRGVARHPDGDVLIVEYRDDNQQASSTRESCTVRVRKQNGLTWSVIAEFPGYHHQLNGPLLVQGNQFRIFASRWDGSQATLDRISSDDAGETWTTEVAHGPITPAFDPNGWLWERIVCQRVYGDPNRIAAVDGQRIVLLPTGFGPPPPPPPKVLVSGTMDGSPVTVEGDKPLWESLGFDVITE